MILENYQESANYILSQTTVRPELAIILGSALGNFAEKIKSACVIDYEKIPYFLRSTVKDHAGKMIFGEIKGIPLVCLSGRFHYYEGYSFEELAIPIRILKMIGIKRLILTNAAGGVNEQYTAGDIMIIKDQIKLMGASPMRGENIEAFGERFFDVSSMYSLRGQDVSRAAAKAVGMTLQEGNYFYMPGPQYETPAEVRAIRVLGGDAVGMSTVTEALTAAHCNIEVLGLSFIANKAAGLNPQKLSFEEVSEAGAKNAVKFQTLLEKIIELF